MYFKFFKLIKDTLDMSLMVACAAETAAALYRSSSADLATITER